MKKTLCLISLLLLSLSCGTRQVILPQKGALQFINPQGDYPDGVEVFVDGLPIGIAMVTEDTIRGVPRDQLAVPSGRILLKTIYEGTVLINDSITVVPNQVTHIYLPKHQY